MSEHDGVKLPSISVQTLRLIVAEFTKDPVKVVAECKLTAPLIVAANLVGDFDPNAFTAGFVSALYYVGHEDLLPKAGAAEIGSAALGLLQVLAERRQEANSSTELDKLISDSSKHEVN